MWSDWRIVVAYLHTGVAIGLPWRGGGIVNGSPWDAERLMNRRGKLPLDCLWITQDCLWIAFGFALGLADDGDCQGVAHGFVTSGLARDCLRVTHGLPGGLPWNGQGIATAEHAR